MFLVREPSSIKGNVGDAALIKSLEIILSNHKINYQFLDSRDKKFFFPLSNFKGLIYFGNDSIAYYQINRKLINKFISLNKPVFIINLSFGENINNEYLLKISNYEKLFLWARDKYSFDLLNSFAKFKNKINLTSDLAYNLPFYISELDNWINTRTKKIIAINVHKDFKIHNEEVFETLNNFLNRVKDNYNFLFIPHDARKKTELNANEKLYKKFKDISFLTYCMEPSHEVSIFKNIYAVITCRMHLGILAIGSGKPAIIIEYNGVKAKGQLRHWDLENDLLITPQTINLLPNKFDNLVNNYGFIKEKIKSHRREIIEMTNLSFNKLLDISLDPKIIRKKNKKFLFFERIKSLVRIITSKFLKIYSYKRVIKIKLRSLFLIIFKKYYSYSNINYDKKLFKDNTEYSLTRNYRLMSKDQLRSFIIIDCHRIEKGLSFKKVVPNFGIETKVLSRLYEMNSIFIDRFGIDDFVLVMIYQCLEEYKNFHQNNRIDCKCENIDNYLRDYKFINKQKSLKRYGGIIEMKKETILASLKNFKSAITTRRSIRTFSKKKLSYILIKECIDRAIKGTPTICNRPINKVYVVQDLEKRRKFLSLQNGNKGYGIDAPILLIITSRLSYFQDDRERRSPYIGGGMFAMSLAYSFHAEGLGTCCLNMDTDYKNDISVRELLNAENETVIMYMLVGHYEEKFNMAFSFKPNTNDVINLIN